MTGRLLTILIVMCVIIAPREASAACATPSGTAGDIIYNNTYNVMQFCNGSSWINMGAANATGIGTLTNGDFCTTDGTNINCTNTGTLPAANGGTGVSNSNTITLAGNVSTAGAFTTSGAFGLTLTTTGTTNATLPIGTTTLVPTTVATLSSLTSAASLVTIGTVTTGTWNGTVIGVQYGGTGDSSLTSNIIYKGNGTSAMASSSLHDDGTEVYTTENVGIGTASPGNLLEVYSNGGNALGVVGSSANSIGIIINNTTASGHSWSFGSSGGGPAPVGDLFFYDNNGGAGERMTIDTSGNVGIGTTAPAGLLSLASTGGGSGNVGITVQNTTASTGKTWRFTNVDSDGTLRLTQPGVTDAITIMPTSGNVGIGTTAPTTKLHVNVASQAGNSAYFGSATPNPISGYQEVVELGGNLLFSTVTGTRYINFGSAAGGGAGALTFRNNVSNANLVTLSDSGNVGIGTTSPAFKLDVNGTLNLPNNTALSFGSGTSQIYRSSSTGGIQFTGTGGANTVTILDGGNVGIGTTSPSDPLDVNGGLTVRGTSFSTINALHFEFISNVGQIFSLQQGVAWRQLDVDGAPLILNVNSGGNVGIGTTSPSYPLHIVRTGIDALAATITDSSSVGTVALFTNAASLGNTLSINVGATGTALGANTIAFGDNAAYRIAWNTSSGNVGIGVTAPNQGRLHVLSPAGVNGTYSATADTGAGAYGVMATAGNTTYYGALGRADGYAFVGSGIVWATGAGSFNQSDGRLKENIVTLTGNLDKIGKLRPVSYTWKPDSMAYSSTGKARQLGLIAQEVKPVVPEAVILNPKPPISLGKDGKKSLDEQLEGGSYGVDYTKFVPLLIGAVQELKADNDNLKAANDKLETRVRALEAARH